MQAQKKCLEAYPEIKLSRVLRRAGSFASNMSQFTELHTSGRAALYWAFRGLNLSSSSVVWMPSFHCGVEVQAALDAGLNVEFYRIGADLTFDTDEIVVGARKRPGPILVIHYFGFGQPAIGDLATECRDRGWILIEDCAHALFSYDKTRALGDYAPVSVYSLRKSLPLYHGGALKVDLDVLRQVTPRPFQAPQLRRFAPRAYVQFAKQEVNRRASERFLALLRSARGRPEVVPGTLAPTALTHVEGRDDRMSAVCRRIARSTDAGHVIRMRRRNYAVLDAMLQKYAGYSSIFPELPAETCPLCLPIRVTRRGELLQQLHASGIRPFVFGAYPHPELPVQESEDTAWMRDTIVGLPVHQDMDSMDIGRLAKAVGPLLRLHRPDHAWCIGEQRLLKCSAHNDHLPVQNM
jgi:dTDP-4-amino-4,6-dideoxygalactose transaminase